MLESKAKAKTSTQETPGRHEIETIEDLRKDTNLWYKILVLLYDLHSFSKDPLCERRLSSTTDVLYFSAPYFSEPEAAKIRNAIANSTTNHYLADPTAGEAIIEETGGLSMKTALGQATIEEAIHERLSRFFEKRRASGDARPCGRHTLFPVYSTVFGVQQGELYEEKFLSRLRRSGLGDSERATTAAGSHSNTSPRKKGKKET